jgi:hypothetical protein
MNKHNSSVVDLRTADSLQIVGDSHSPPLASFIFLKTCRVIVIQLYLLIRILMEAQYPRNVFVLRRAAMFLRHQPRLF